MISLITTCMGRLSFLKKTLPNWIETTSFPIVVVDSSCPEGTADWIGGAGFDDRVSVVRHEAELRNGRAEFSPSRARNAGAATVKDGHLLFLDADTLISPGLEIWLASQAAPDSIHFVPLRPDTLELGGALMTPVDAFRKAGGFDEHIRGWGSEDTELKVRLLLAGLKCEAIPFAYLKAIHHSDAVRVENHAQKDLQTASLLNAVYLNGKYRRLTEKSYVDWLEDPRTHGIFAHPAG